MRKIILILFAASILYPAVFAQEKGLIIGYTSDDISLDPNDGVWEKAIPLTVSLGKQMITQPFGGGSVSSVTARAIHNGKVVAFLLEWVDGSKDTGLDVDSYRDSAALQFPVDSNALPSPFMGDSNNLVNIWQWRADLQADLDGDDTFNKESPLFEGVWLFPQDEEIFLKEIQGMRIRGESAVDELVARGFGTLEIQEHQDVIGRGVNSGGKWKVVFLRPLKSTDSLDAVFDPTKPTKVNFAIWDGQKSDVNGRKSVSMVWTDVTVKETEKGVCGPTSVLMLALIPSMLFGLRRKFLQRFNNKG